MTITIRELKLNFKNYNLPNHWLVDWLLFVIQKSPNFLITNNDYQLSENELIAFCDGIKKCKMAFL